MKQRLSRRLLWGIILVLIVTNAAVLYGWQQDEISVSGKEEIAADLPGEEPVAIIGGETITYDTWMEALERASGQKMLESLIDQTVIGALADEADLQISEKVINRELALLHTSEGVVTDEVFQEQEEVWRKTVTERLLLEELLTMDFDISEAEMQAYYEEHEDQYQINASYQISHLIVDNDEAAEQALEQLDSGTDFASVAREFSQDTQSRGNGGYIGYYTASSSMLPSGYANQIESLEAGSYSAPFSAEDGIAIIFVNRILPEVKLSYEEAKNSVRRAIALNELEQPVEAEVLWDELDVTWYYGEEWEQ